MNFVFQFCCQKCLISERKIDRSFSEQNSAYLQVYIRILLFSATNFINQYVSKTIICMPSCRRPHRSMMNVVQAHIPSLLQSYQSSICITKHLLSSIRKSRNFNPTDFAFIQFLLFYTSRMNIGFFGGGGILHIGW